MYEYSSTTIPPEAKGVDEFEVKKAYNITLFRTTVFWHNQDFS